MDATRSYCPEEIYRNGLRLMDLRIKLFLCVEGRFVQVHSAEELALASRIVSVYHAQIGGGARSLDDYMDAVEDTLDGVWAELGDECDEEAEQAPGQKKPQKKEKNEGGPRPASTTREKNDGGPKPAPVADAAVAAT